MTDPGPPTLDPSPGRIPVFPGTGNTAGATLPGPDALAAATEQADVVTVHDGIEEETDQ